MGTFLLFFTSINGFSLNIIFSEFCDGYCPYEVDDHYNYYWFFDVNDILAATNVYDPKPYAYGVWDVPFDNGGLNNIVGGAFDPDSSVLYVVLSNAASLEQWDKVPLIVSFKLLNL